MPDEAPTAALIRGASWKYQELNVDVVALQEVEHHDVEGYDLLDYLAAQNRAHTHFRPESRASKQAVRQCHIDATFVILASKPVDLSLPGHEPRGAIDVTLDGNGRRVQVVATHSGADAWRAPSTGAPASQVVRHWSHGYLYLAGRSE